MKKLIISLLLYVSFSVLANQNATEIDNRIVIELEQEQKVFVLLRMRKMLETLTKMQVKLLEENLEATHDLALELMRFTAKNHPDGLRERMPLPFRAMSQSMNKSWKKLSKKQTNSKVIQQEIISIMSTCNACHQSYRIE